MQLAIRALMALVFATSGVGWYQYYRELPRVLDYHYSYFAFAWVPAAALLLALLLLSIERRGSRILGALLLIPTTPLWILSVLVVFADFKIH